jgi:hypothetical protein
MKRDELDACDVSFDIPDKNTSDADIAALALYADVDFTDSDAVAQRKAEWEALFGGATR